MTKNVWYCPKNPKNKKNSWDFLDVMFFFEKVNDYKKNYNTKISKSWKLIQVAGPLSCLASFYFCIVVSEILAAVPQVATDILLLRILPIWCLLFLMYPLRNSVSRISRNWPFVMS